MPRPFRLQTVLRLRETARDARRAQLADATRAAAVLGDRRAALATEIAGLVGSRREASAIGETDVAWLLNANRYELTLRTQEKEFAENQAKVEAEIERRSAALAEAEREVRALELLRERDERAERKAALRRESKRLDEFAGVAHTKRHGDERTRA